MSLETPLFAWHQEHGGRMVDFSGWALPVQYETGIIKEHLTCRKYGALFDICHMGRFSVRGPSATGFLNRVLTNDCLKLEPGQAQYTIIADPDGRAVDDAFLYRFVAEEYLLVVNASNLNRDWDWLNRERPADVEMVDRSRELAMLAVQGPVSEDLIKSVADTPLPRSGRNSCGPVTIAGVKTLVARTGYTGEPVAFEVFAPWDEAAGLWGILAEKGKQAGLAPAGLGARDTLRLEASLPLYGHELSGSMPIMALPQASFAVDLSDQSRAFIGREALAAQVNELKTGSRKIVEKLIRPVIGLAKGMFRDGSPVLIEGRSVGHITSGTMVPAWRFNNGLPSEDSFTRALGLAYLDREVEIGDRVDISYRNKTIPGLVVKGQVQITPPYLKAVEN